MKTLDNAVVPTLCTMLAIYWLYLACERRTTINIKTVKIAGIATAQCFDFRY